MNQTAVINKELNDHSGGPEHNSYPVNYNESWPQFIVNDAAIRQSGKEDPAVWWRKNWLAAAAALLCSAATLLTTATAATTSTMATTTNTIHAVLLINGALVIVAAAVLT